MLNLLTARRFGPLFVTQFLGAFNDNLFKTAFIFLVAFHLRAGDSIGAATLATVATGVFILPFLLFSGIAGEIADARDKAAIARWVKIVEIAFMALGATALALESEAMALAVIFLMGVHSTIFGPVKYAILPQHLGEDELLLGTGLVEGATFVAILLGQIAGGLLPAGVAGPVAIGVAVAGWLAARYIPRAPPSRPAAAPANDRPFAIDWNPLTASRRALGEAFANSELRIATICISWFWALGAIYTSQFVPLARNEMGGSEGVATLFLAAFSIGVAVGSAGVSRLLGGRISSRLSPWAGLVMALAGIDLLFAERSLGGVAGDVATFLGQPSGWRVLVDLAVLAVAGGIFSVPLYGVLQTATNPAARSRAIAANNIVNAGFQVAAVLAIGAAIARGAGVPAVLVAAGLTVVLLIPLLRKLPR